MRQQPRLYQRGERGTWWVDYGQVGGLRKVLSMRTACETTARQRAQAVGAHLLKHAESERLSKLTMPSATPEWATVLQTNEAQAVFERLWKNSRSRALQHKMLWAMSRRDFDAMVAACNGLCAVTGLPLSMSQERRGPFKPSIDRIDNSMGYSVGNCRIVLMAVNFAMNVWGDEVFRLIALSYASEELRRSARQLRGRAVPQHELRT